ncbi:uncharacterized protein BCR38DRAFT_485716 [Pseudomassariella vexata]|uniref:Uncharacterized protein n=1 Tax=Pseudomassariella vexata TaxID=1141098 RepID=A0A1Y2DUG4_9PEZI|nr:uncharacterized protein BCR38DRAFT_485716 [Pseudomassariella vexata]ORY62932.1 hypothetical protein BCR38DRAFT_485716 [Pseudomassariella vexata]
MPSQDIKSVLSNKPVSFTLKTGNGKWKCTLHSDRSALEKARSAAPVPGISRSDSGLSTTSSSSAGSTHSH